MKRSKLYSIALIAVGALALGGCATAPKINVEFDPAVDFTAVKTFAVLPIPKDIPGVDPGLILRVGPAAVSAARASMLERGFIEESDASRADIAVLVHGKSVPKTEVTDWGMQPYYGRAGWYRGYPYGMYGTSNVTVDQYNEGTLIVEIFDVKTKGMVWVGWVSGRTTTKTENQAGNVSQAVTNILATYPVVGGRPVAPPK